MFAKSSDACPEWPNAPLLEARYERVGTCIVRLLSLRFVIAESAAVDVVGVKGEHLVVI